MFSRLRRLDYVSKHGNCSVPEFRRGSSLLLGLELSVDVWGAAWRSSEGAYLLVLNSHIHPFQWGFAIFAHLSQIDCKPNRLEFFIEAICVWLETYVCKSISIEGNGLDVCSVFGGLYTSLRFVFWGLVRIHGSLESCQLLGVALHCWFPPWAGPNPASLFP